jgi:aminoglycoside phosphotransferase (APT) family kinase protein
MMTTRSASSRRAICQQILDPTFRSRLVKAFAKGLTIEGLTVRPMRRRPGSRHVFSCELMVLDHRSGKQRSIELIGKRDTTCAAGKAAREFEAMQLLWDAGFGLDERFRIPRPVQHFPELHFILQGKAEGSKLRTYVGKGNDESLSYARITGLWLAKLHSLKVPSPQVCTYVNEIGSLRLFVAALSADQPKLAAELQQRAATIEHAFASFRGVRATMVHGDFHPDHIFVSRDFVTVIDFERFCVTDPARDMGSFMSHLHTMACLSGRSPHAANREADAFIASYFSAVPLIQRAEIARRIAPYVALSALEALYYVASVLKVEDSDRIAMYVKCMQESELRATEYAAPHLTLRAAG